MKSFCILLLLAALPLSLLAALPQLELGAYYAPGKFVVNFQPNVLPLQVRSENGAITTGISALDNLNKEFAVTDVEKLFPGARLAQDAVELSGYYVFHFRGSDQRRLEAVLERFAALPFVEHAEPVGIHPTNFTPNDPSYPSQWHHNQTNDHDIDTPQAWDVQKGASNAILGIADTGVLWGHADLSSNIWTNTAEMSGTTGVDDDGNGYVDDYRGWDWVNVGSGWSGEDLSTPDNDPIDFNGHGTHCAGITAAVMNNSTGVAGIAGGNYPTQGARILALRIGWSGNYLGQEVGYIDMSYAASAFYYATQKGVCAINCSWGSSNSGGLGAAVDNAVANGMVVCSAAGNSNNQSASYLCSRTDVVSVASTDQNDVKSSFSSYGTWVDISAPGSSIYSTYSNHYTATYATLSGTSMATPMIVGVSGLLKSQNPTWTRTQIIPQIQNTADNINSLNPSYSGLLGSGRVNAFNALGGSTPTPTITVTYPNGSESWTVGQTYTITWTSQNLTGNVNILLNRSFSGGTWETLYSNTTNDGSQSWTVSGATGTACRIRVESYTNTSIYDLSNANFSIVSTPTPTITVTYPNGGESWTVGQSYTITWTSQSLTGNVNILLNRSYSGGTWETLYSNTTNDGLQSWTVSGATGTACRIRVESYTTTSIYDLSNANFSIVSGGGQPVVIFSDGFEGSFPNSAYATYDNNGTNGRDYWDDRTNRPHTGSKSCYCAGIGSPSHPPYDNYMNAYFYRNSSYAINVGGYTSVTYSFWIWYSAESGYDYLKAQYYNGVNWIDLPNGSWTGSSGSWVQKAYTLTGFTTFRFRFNFTSDYSITAEGAYVDDIQISGIPADGGILTGPPTIIDLTANVVEPVPPSPAKVEAEGFSELLNVPIQFELSQNVPNPFNPTTTLTFTLPEAVEVDLVVFNSRGENVAILVDGLKAAGTHEVVFDGSNLATGVYFARLQAGTSSALVKMMLVK